MNRLVVNEIVYANRKGIKSSLPKETCRMDEGGLLKITISVGISILEPWADV